MENSFLWAVLFSDMKNFTLKTSLLTQKQLDIILTKQEEVILSAIWENKWKVVKTMWDSYMIIFENIDNSFIVAKNIQEKLEEYNKTQKNNLNKIELRISLEVGNLHKRKNIVWEDYFWDSINLASRILEITWENKIFTTSNIKKTNIKEENILELWKKTFKWILQEVEIYEILYKKEDIENKKYWTLKKNWYSFIVSKDEEIRNSEIESFIFKVSSVAWFLSIQPIPFLDAGVIFLHLYIAKEIWNKYKIELWKEKIKEIIWTISVSVWWIYATAQIITGISKIWLPWFWGFLTLPINFALTYSIWTVLNKYFYYQSNHIELSNSEIKETFLDAKNKWIAIWKKEKNKIIEEWKRYKDEIMEKIKSFM